MSRTKSNGLFGTKLMSRRGQAAGKAAVVAAMLAAAAQASAGIPGFTNKFINAGTGAYADPTNWSYGVAPTYADITLINQGTATIAPGDITQSAILTLNGTAAVSMTGGSLTSYNDIRVGYNTGDNATFTQSGGNVVINNRGALWAGDGGTAASTGTITLSGGTTTVGNPFSYGTDYADVVIGNGATGSVGTLNINGGTLTNYALVIVGRSGGTGAVNMTAGTWNMGGDYGFGNGTGKDTVTQSGGTINVGTYVSYPHNTATSIGAFVLGTGNNSTTTRATYTISGSAQMNVNSHMYIGGGAGTNADSNVNVAGFADLVMNGGTITLGNANNVTGVLYVGNATAAASATGTVTVNAGSTLTAPNGITLGQRTAGTGAGIGSGTLTINAGQVLSPKGTLTIGAVSTAAIGGNGTLNLAGGRLQIVNLSWVKPTSAAPTQVFNWTGGRLEMNSATSSFVIVNNGGTLAPGTLAPGALTITGTQGSYTQNSTGTLELDLAGETSYDSVNASGGTVGAITLGGTVNALLGSGYTPAYGATFPVLAAKTLTDTATWNLPALPAGLAWDQRVISEGGNQLKLLSVASSASSTPLSAGSWTGPGATDAAYVLGGAGGSVSVDANVTAGYLEVGGTGNWSLDGASTLTFSASSGRAGLTAFGNTPTINAPINFAGNGAIATATAGTTVTVNGTVAGSGTVTKTGPGTLALKNAGSTFSGTWAISGGALNIDDDTDLGAAAASLSITSAAVNVTNAWNSSRAIALQGTGMNLTTGADSSLSGVISGTGGLTYNAAHTLTISGANTYTGATTVNAGILSTGAVNTIPAGSAVVLKGASPIVATLQLNGNAQNFGSLASTAANASVLTGGADLTVGSDNTNTQFRGNIDGGGSGTFTKTGTGLLEVTGIAGISGSPNTSINTASIHVAGGILQYDNVSLGLLNLPSGTITIDAGAALSLGGAGVGGFVTTPITGAGSLYFHGGKVEMAQANDYAGDTEVRLGSTILIDDMGALGSSTSPLIAKPATLAFSNANSLFFDVGGTFSKPIEIDAPATLSLNSANGGTVTLDQPITGNGTLNITGGTIVMAAANTNNSPTVISPAAATVQLGIDNAFSSQQYTLVNGTLDLNGFNQTVGSLIGLNTGKVILSSGKTLTTGADNRDNNGISSTYAGYAGVLTGAGGLTKIGGGLAIMIPKYDAGNLPFTGSTEVQAGALRWDTDSRTLNATSGINVDAGALMIFNFTTAGSGNVTPIISVPISGNGTVEKDGTDLLQLSGSNTYTGGTRIGGGTLIVNSDNNLGAAPGSLSPQNITFSGAGTLKFGTAFNLNANRGISLAATGTIDTNGADLAVAGPIAGVGGFSKAGLGTLTVNNINSGGTVAISAGNLTVLAQGGTANANKASAVTVAAGSKLDLTDNKLIVTGTTLGAWNGTAYTGVTGQIVAGRNGGSWDGSSIVTSMSLANSAHQLTTLAVAGASDISKTTFGGLAVNPTDVLVMYTYDGDMNLDGKINGDDYFRIDSGYTAHSTGYENGDLNYDGRVDADDYFLIDRNYSEQGTPIAAGASILAGASLSASMAGVAAVPEPASLALMSLGAMTILSRRRRRA